MNTLKNTSSNRQHRGHLAYLSLPAGLWFLFFLVLPVLMVTSISFFSRGTYGGIEWTFTLDNFQRAFEPVYLKIFWGSVKLSTLTTLICLCLAYPMAWTMAVSKGATRSLLILALAIPFLMNLIIRVYAIKLFVGLDGPLQAVLTAVGLHFDRFAMTQNDVLVTYGMISTYLPFMVFPLYAALEKLDFQMVEAAQDLGAGPLKILVSVIVPNTKTALVSGITLVFVPCLGEYVIPDLLGGAKTMLVGNLITEQFLKARHWPFGAALSTLLIVILFLFPFFLRRLLLKPKGAT